MKIIDSNIESSKVIISNHACNYVFVNAWVVIEVEVNNETFTIQLENGDYPYGDYNRPSSEFSEISEYSSPEFVILRNLGQSDIESIEVIKNINEDTGRDWDYTQWLNLYETINEASDFAFDEIVQPEKDRVKSVIKELNENNYFVEVTEREPYGAYDEGFRVCSEARGYKFSSHADAIDFRDKERDKGNLSHLIDGERFYELEK